MNKILAKILTLVKTHQSDLVFAACVTMLTVISFNLGKISASDRSTENVTLKNGQMAQFPVIAGQPGGGTAPAAGYHSDPSVVASKKSKSKLYHFTWCPGAKQISAANKLTFPDEQTAVAAGYALASNCAK